MLSRRQWVRVLLGGGGLLGAYLVFGASKEREVLRALRELASAVSDRPGDTARAKLERLERAKKHMSRGLAFYAPEVGRVLTGEEVAGVEVLATRLGYAVRIDQTDVRFQGEEAHASLLVELVYHPAGEERREWRHAEALLTERDGVYQLDRLEVSAPLEHEPEPRP